VFFLDFFRRIFVRPDVKVIPQIEITQEMIDEAGRYLALSDDSGRDGDEIRGLLNTGKWGDIYRPKSALERLDETHPPQDSNRMATIRDHEEAVFREMLEKYGDTEIARMISRGSVWVGMTKEQLTDSVGFPDTLDEKVTRTKAGARRRLVYKYGRTGKRSFSKRVFLEDGSVTGWKISD